LQCDRGHRTLAEEDSSTARCRMATGQISSDKEYVEEGLAISQPGVTAKIGGLGIQQKVTNHESGR